MQPSAQPVMRPSRQPTRQPTMRPSRQPTGAKLFVIHSCYYLHFTIFFDIGWINAFCPCTSDVAQSNLLCFSRFSLCPMLCYIFNNDPCSSSFSTSRPMFISLSLYLDRSCLNSKHNLLDNPHNNLLCVQADNQHNNLVCIHRISPLHVHRNPLDNLVDNLPNNLHNNLPCILVHPLVNPARTPVNLPVNLPHNLLDNLHAALLPSLHQNRAVNLPNPSHLLRFLPHNWRL